MSSLTRADVDLEAVPLRHPGRWVAAAVVLGLLAAIVVAFAKGQIDWSVPPTYLFSTQLAMGAANTLLISVCAQLLGIGLGVVAAIMRQSENPVLKVVAEGYVWLFRGTPVMVQLLLWYNLSLVFQHVPFTQIPMNDVMTPFLAALLGLGINEGAYMAEIVRSGLGSVDKGQLEAAAALGMSPALTMRRVTLPQAMRVIVPPTGNEFINMLKTSSLAYSIQYVELLQNAVRISSHTLMVIEMLITVSIWYLLLTTVFSIGQWFLERRFNRAEAGMGGFWQNLRTNLTPGRNT